MSMVRTLSPKVDCYTEFAESIRQPIVIVDRRYHIVSYNESFHSLCSCSPQELNGKNFFELSCHSTQKEVWQTDLISKTDSGIEYEYIHPDERGRKFMLSANRIASEGEDGLIALFFREITLEKMDEQRREDFISIASHELKTPISVISAYSQIIEKEARDSAAPMVRIYASKINEQSKKLVALATTLLDISAIQTGKISLQISSIDLTGLIEELAENFSYTFTSHVTELNVEPGLVIQGDRQKVIQVLNNLISNAIKYSPESGKIMITASKSLNDVLIGISDQGIGIPEEEKARLFQKFSRIDLGSQLNIQGWGLGLYISNEIVRIHNGSLSFKSERGKGSTFYISLPYTYMESR